MQIRVNEKQAVFQSLIHPTEEIDDFDGESSKLKKERSLILDGNDLQIINENAFYDLVNMD